MVKTPGVDLLPGTLSIELNSCDTGNGSVSARTMGTVGIMHLGSVNRSGLGARCRLRHCLGEPRSARCWGGASHASRDSATIGFGLGSAPFGKLEVAWPGGVRNRLYRVRDGESVLSPEIPCSYDTGASFFSYFRCVRRSIAELSSANVLSSREAVRFFASALLAYVDNWSTSRELQCIPQIPLPS